MSVFTLILYLSGLGSEIIYISYPHDQDKNGPFYIDGMSDWPFLKQRVKKNGPSLDCTDNKAAAGLLRECAGRTESFCFCSDFPAMTRLQPQSLRY